ncbi:MAG: hypothetical protein M1824_004840 [Vezdaea acicularis]|nr:MAG: hypothetical protein M1824_004840 [Vezdaea acicularis]
MSTAQAKLVFAELGVAIQSVVYFVVSCSSCRQAIYRRKRKQEAVNAKRAKQQIEMDEPGLYRHPSPFATNPHWDEEIRMGPGPPLKKKAAKNGKGDRGRPHTTDGSTGPEITLNNEGRSMSLSDDDDNWNRRRYQREDEDLWGIHMNRPNHRDSMSGLSRVGSNSSDKYFTARNPPVNELHPPVVSKLPTNKNQMKWMLQPPPRAAVMEGKERANRSRSGSARSSQRGGPRSQGGSVRSRRTTTSTSGGQRHDRLTPSNSIDTVRKRAKPPPISISEDEFTPNSPDSSPSPTRTRPPLSTIASSSKSTSYRQKSNTTSSPNAPQSKPLRDLLSPQTSTINTLNTRPSSPPDSAVGIPLRLQSSHGHPPSSSRDKDDPDAADDEDNAHTHVPTIESKFPWEFRFPDPGTTPRSLSLEKRQKRWSLDV